MLLIIALAAQALGIYTGWKAVQFDWCVKCWRIVAISILICAVTFIAGIIALLSPGEPRFQYNLGPLLMIAHGLIISGMHEVLSERGRQEC